MLNDNTITLLEPDEPMVKVNIINVVQMASLAWAAIMITIYEGYKIIFLNTRK